MKRLAILVIPLFLTACVADNPTPTNLTLKQLITIYVAPTVCEKMQECDIGFSIKYPNGVGQCAVFVESSITGDRNQVTGCDNVQATTCRNDMIVEMCPASKAPPSCDVCSYTP